MLSFISENINLKLNSCIEKKKTNKCLSNKKSFSFLYVQVEIEVYILCDGWGCHNLYHKNILKASLGTMFFLRYFYFSKKINLFSLGKM